MKTKSSRRPDPFDRPLDTVLELLRVHQLAYRPHHEDVERWIAECPICRDEMALRESYVGGPVTIICRQLCHESRIASALASEPRPAEGLDLAEAASRIAHQALALVESSCR
jgi:hypothetical protein